MALNILYIQMLLASGVIVGNILHIIQTKISAYISLRYFGIVQESF
jgi:hypothetical protein